MALRSRLFAKDGRLGLGLLLDVGRREEVSNVGRCDRDRRPREDEEPHRAHPEAHDEGSDRRDHDRERVRDDRAQQAAGDGDGFVAIARSRFPSEQRDDPERTETEHGEADEHPHPVLASRVSQEQDPPVDRDDGERDGDDPE